MILERNLSKNEKSEKNKIFVENFSQKVNKILKKYSSLTKRVRFDKSVE